MVGPQADQPHAEIYCGKGHFDGVSEIGDLYEEHPLEDECPDYKRFGSVSGKHFFVSEEAVEHLINELTRY